MTLPNETRRSASSRQTGIWLLALVSLVSLALTIFDYFNAGNGIHGTPGVLLVIISSALMLVAALVIGIGWARRGWFHVLLLVLILLDIFGTAAAGYFLESMTLVGLMVVALICWLVHIASPREPAALTTEVAP